MEAWAGFDVGGQSVKAVAIDVAGTIVAHGSRPTGIGADVTSIARALASLIDEFETSCSLADAVGAGVAGVMGADGVLRGSPNLPTIVGVPIETALAEALGRPVRVDNDANCAALGEGLGGAAQGVADYLLITLGSGIGSGLVLDGQVYHGVTGYACELGHTIIVHGGRVCGCGNRGCLEAYASESAARAMLAEMNADLRSAVERLHGEGQGYAQALFVLARDGNRAAVEVTREMIDVLGTGLASAINLLDVTMLVVGGGIAPAVLQRRSELEASMNAALFARDVSSIRVVAAVRGSDAGAVGAARLAMPPR